MTTLANQPFIRMNGLGNEIVVVDLRNSQAMVTAEAYYGYGDYQKAADLFRAALAKQGVDKDVANLGLGMALARAGEVPGCGNQFHGR